MHIPDVLARRLSWASQRFVRSEHRRTAVHGWRVGLKTPLEGVQAKAPQIPPANAPVVAIVDGGFDYNHPELKDAIAINPNEIPGNGKDDDGNGYVDDYYGVNVWQGHGDPSKGDHIDHGTWCAGRVGAVGIKVPGVAAGKVRVLPVTGSFTHSTELSSFEKSVDYIVARKKTGTPVVTVSASFGETYSASEEPEVKRRYTQAVQKLLDADIVFVVAAGNDGQDIDQRHVYPARVDLPNVITVAAMDANNDRLAGFSNYGVATVEGAGRGSRVVSTAPNNRYAPMSGTSMSTPEMAAVTGREAAAHPGEKAPERVAAVKALLEKDPDLTGRVSTGAKVNLDALP